MKTSKQMIPNVDMETEYSELGGLLSECEAFLDRWSAYEVHGNDTPTDAIVAIFSAQQQIVKRRAYILSKLTQTELPF